MKSPSGQDHTESRMIEAIFAFSLGPFQSLLFSHVNDLNKVCGHCVGQNGCPIQGQRQRISLT